MIRFKCPSCGASIKAPDQAEGKRTKCPSCAAPVTVPEAVFDAEAVDEGDTSPSAADLFADKPKPKPAKPALPAKPVRAARPPREPDRVPCPACGENIIATAQVCRFCDYIVDDDLRAEEEARKKAAKRRKKARRPSYSSSRGGSYDDDELSGLEWFLCICCSNIGCILGIIYAIQGRSKGGKMIGIAMVMQGILLVIRFAILAAAGKDPLDDRR